jgi:MGT family glycosyltransferase
MSVPASRPRGRFLMAVIDGGGTLPPAMGVAAELVRRGHTVSVLADPTVEPSARAAGCDFTPWRAAPRIDSVAEQTAMVIEFERGSPLRQFAAIRDRLIVGGAPGFAADVVRAVADAPVDAILAEAAVPGILIGAQTTGLPVAALMPNIYLRPTPGLPMMGTGWRPARGPLGRTRDAAALRLVRRVSATCLPGLNATLADHRLPPVADMFELLDRCTEVLVLTSPSLDFSPPHLPPNVRYVGPQLDDPDWATQGEPGSWRPDGDGPLVLVAGSSVFQHQTDLLRRATAALGRLPVRGLVTTGRAVDPRDVPAPDNVRVVRAAPHRAVLEEAAVAVTHAGHGSLLKALAAGVPLVCMPMGRDQKDNTVRALRLGAGVRVSPKASPETIAAAVGRVLAEPAYALAARRFADTLAAEARSRPSAADRAEALLGSDHPPPAASGGQLGG